jgi:hypothetical protein
MKASPYRLLGARQEKALHFELNRVLTEWKQDWLPNEVDCSFNAIHTLYDYSQNHDTVIPQKLVNWVDDNWCGLLKTEEVEYFGAMLIGGAEDILSKISSSKLLPEVGEQALLELAQRIITNKLADHENTQFLITDKVLPINSKQRGSGVITVQLKILNMSFDFVISSTTVDRYVTFTDVSNITEMKPLSSLKSALGKQKLRSTVSIGIAELTLSELASIQTGDVITLDKNVNEPATMQFSNNAGPVCNGLIGIKNNSFAFRILQLKD